MGKSGFPTGAAYVINLESHRTVNSLLLDHAFSGNLTIGANSTNTLTITSGTITRDASTNSNTALRVPIKLGANAIWSLAGGGETQFDGDISITGTGFTLTRRGTGTLRLGIVDNTVSNLIF